MPRPAAVLALAFAGLGAATECYCPNWRYTNFNCSAACCDLPRPIVCPPPPAVNPPTAMKTVTVDGALEMGAFTPKGEAPTIELNYTGSNGWVFHMSGGGWGFKSNKTGEGGAAFHADGTPQPPHSGCYLFCDGIMSDDPHQNPNFHTYNKVFLPIYDGTSFTGNLDKQYQPTADASPVWVRGARIVTATIAFLLQSPYYMSHAKDVIITGGSSGGMAVYLNCDRIAEQIRKANSSILVTCLADAGMFLDHDSLDGHPSLSPKFVESFYGWNASGAINEECIKHYTALGTPWKCIFSQNVVPFIDTPLFLMQTLYDSYQLTHILGLGGCAGYGKDLSGCPASTVAAVQAYGAALRGNVTNGVYRLGYSRGGFAPSCSAHCQTVANEHPAALWNWPERWTIADPNRPSGEATPLQTFVAWYTGLPPDQESLVETIELGANPKCVSLIT